MTEMPHDALPARPLPACRCPVCGEPNGCVPAATGHFERACWCTSVRIAPEALARVPAGAPPACLCPRCAQGLAPQDAP